MFFYGALYETALFIFIFFIISRDHCYSVCSSRKWNSWIPDKWLSKGILMVSYSWLIHTARKLQEILYFIFPEPHCISLSFVVLPVQVWKHELLNYTYRKYLHNRRHYGQCDFILIFLLKHSYIRLLYSWPLTLHIELLK